MANDPHTTASNETDDQAGQDVPEALIWGQAQQAALARMGARIAVKGYDQAAHALDETNDLAQRSMVRDIDAILARLEGAIATENTAMDALLKRLAA